MGTELYNPCKDGFAAKAWECLRRNKSFNQLLKSGILRGRTKASRDHLAAILGRLPSRFAFSAYCEIGMGGLTEDQLPPWPEIGDEAKMALTSAAERMELPTKVNLPIAGEGPFDNSEILWRLGAYDGLIVRIPKAVLDTGHRRHIMSYLDALVPQTSTKYQWRKPEGGLLGTELAWATYLKFEQLERRTGSRVHALNLTPYVSSKTPDREVERLMRGDSMGKAEFDRLKKIGRHKRHSQSESYVLGIEAAIASVYPEFKPHYMRRKG